MDPTRQLLDALFRIRELLARPETDLIWSSWKSTAEPIAEIDRHIATLNLGQSPHQHDLTVLFAPTGGLHEVSLASGWSAEFLELAAQVDHALGSRLSDKKLI